MKLMIAIPTMETVPVVFMDSLLALVQYLFRLVPLDAATYYVSYVPVAFPWGWLVALNIMTILISLLILLLPSMIIAKISPAKVMHFE